MQKSCSRSLICFRNKINKKIHTYIHLKSIKYDMWRSVIERRQRFYYIILYLIRSAFKNTICRYLKKGFSKKIQFHSVLFYIRIEIKKLSMFILSIHLKNEPLVMSRAICIIYSILKLIDLLSNVKNSNGLKLISR